MTVEAIAVDADTLERLAFENGRTITLGDELAILSLDGTIYVAPLRPIPAQRQPSA
jgi:hypothetical protein